MTWLTALKKSVIPLRVIKAFLVKASLLKAVVNIPCGGDFAFYEEEGFYVEAV